MWKMSEGFWVYFFFAVVLITLSVVGAMGEKDECSKIHDVAVKDQCYLDKARHAKQQ